MTPSSADQLEVLICGERIAGLLAPGNTPAAALGSDAEVIDAAGLIVLPGAIDGHTHFGQDDPVLFGPDPDDYEGFEVGGLGASAGGVTTVIEMPQARPPATDGQSLRRKRQLAAEDAVVDFALWGGVVPDQPTDAIEDQIDEGAVGFKAFMCNSDPTYPGVTDAQLLAALQALAATDLVLGVHAENDALLQAGLARMELDRRTDPLAHADSRPPIVEVEAVARAALLAEEAGARVHIVHLSTAAAADVVAATRARGVRITCETCPQYLLLDRDDLARLGPIARCAPPLRSRTDVEQLWAHLESGTIDCVTTDHCAFTYETRLRGQSNIFLTPNGVPGVETLVPVFVTEARRRGFAWPKIAELLAGAPARLWHLAPQKGSLAPGADADLILLDPTREWRIEGACLHQMHKWTPFQGFAATARVVRVFLRGRTVFHEGRYDRERPEERGKGRFLRPSGAEAGATWSSDRRLRIP